MASGTDEKVKYVSLAIRDWSDIELIGYPVIQTPNPDTGSVGFMEVFDDVETLKAAYPDVEILKVTKVRD